MESVVFLSDTVDLEVAHALSSRARHIVERGSRRVVADFEVDGLMFLLGVQEGLGELVFQFACRDEYTALGVSGQCAGVEAYARSSGYAVHNRQQSLEAGRLGYADGVPEGEYLNAFSFEGVAEGVSVDGELSGYGVALRRPSHKS